MNHRANHLLFLSWLFIALFATAVMSEAAEVELSWDAPTTRMNGDALTPDELGDYTVYLWAGAEVVRTIAVPPSDTTTIIDGLEELTSGPIGVTVTASDTLGLTSVPSNRLDFNISKPAPITVKLQWSE